MALDPKALEVSLRSSAVQQDVKSYSFSSLQLTINKLPMFVQKLGENINKQLGILETEIETQTEQLQDLDKEKDKINKQKTDILDASLNKIQNEVNQYEKTISTKVVNSGKNSDQVKKIITEKIIEVKDKVNTSMQKLSESVKDMAIVGCSRVSTIFGLTKKIFTPLLHGCVNLITEHNNVYKTLKIGFSSFGDILSNFFDKTFGNMLTYLGGPLGSILYKSMKFVGSIGWKILDWAATIGFKTIDVLWNTMKWLGNIGWEVISKTFSTIADLAKAGGSFIFDILLDVLSNPIVIVGLSATVTFFWPKIKDIINEYVIEPIKESIIDPILGKIKTFVNDAGGVYSFVTKYINESELGKLFKSFSDLFVSILNSPTVKSIWEETIKFVTGITPDAVKDIFGNVKDFGITFWNSLKDIWRGITPELIDDAKSIYDSFMFFKRVLSNDMNLISSYNLEKTRDEYKEKILYSAAVNLKQYSEIIVQQSLLNAYMNNMNIKDKEKLKKVMIDNSNKELDSFLDTFSFEGISDVKSEILSTISLKTDKFINDIVGKNIEDLNYMKFDLLKKSKKQQYLKSDISNLMYEIELEKDVDIFEKKIGNDINIVTKNLEKSFNTFNINTKNINNNLQYDIYQLNTTFQLNNEISNSFQESYEKINKAFEKHNYIDIFLDDYSRIVLKESLSGVLTLDNIQKVIQLYTKYNIPINPKILDLYKKISEQNKKYNISDVISYRNIELIDQLFKLKPYNKDNTFEVFDHAVFLKRMGYSSLPIIYDYINNFYPILENKELVKKYLEFFDKIPQFMKGGIVKDPTLAVIGEGGSPELIIPINKEGLNFMYSSLMDKFDEYEKEIEKDDQKINIVNMISNQINPPDETLYDLRNLSLGLIGV